MAAFFRAGFCFHSWQGRQGSLHLPMLQCVPCSAPLLQCGTSTGDDLKGFLDLVLLIGKIQRECTGLKTKSGKSLHSPKAWRFVGFSAGLLFFGMFSLVFLNFFLIFLVLFVFFPLAVANAIPVFLHTELGNKDHPLPNLCWFSQGTYAQHLTLF